VSSVKAKVRDYITTNILMGRGTEVLTDSASFLELGILDSTGVLEVVALLEGSFGITVTDADMVPANLDSLDAIDAYVNRKLQDQAA
jgi:acyl carrier protein